MSRKTSTAALDTFCRRPLWTALRVPSRPAGETPRGLPSLSPARLLQRAEPRLRLGARDAAFARACLAESVELKLSSEGALS